MSKAEILAELPQLTPEERDEIRLRLAELDNRWLDDQKGLIESRIEAHEKHPETAIPWEEFNARLRRRLRQ